MKMNLLMNEGVKGPLRQIFGIHSFVKCKRSKEYGIERICHVASAIVLS